MMFMLLQKLFLQRIYFFHGLENVLSIDIVPWRCDNGSLVILLADHLNTGIQLVIGNLLGTAEDNGSCILDLIVVKLTVVFHIHLALLCIYDNSCTVDHNVVSNILNGFDDVGQLADSGRLNDNAVRRILLQYLL